MVQPASSGSERAANPASMRGQLVLVLPFDDHSGRPNMGWISEAFPELINRRLASAGFMPITRDDRMYALDHLGLPQNFRPSRASAIRLAQTLDADYVVFGSFTTDGPRLRARAQVLDVNALRLSAPVEEEADAPHLLDVLNALAWRLAMRFNPNLRIEQQTFSAADPNLTVTAFENYVRGLVENDTDLRIRHLKEAIRLDPAFSPSLFALAKLYYANQQFELAATTFGKMPTNDPNAREADFYRGLAYLYVGNYIKAEDAFAFVAKQLPLPEVVNNEGVAASRRGKDATSLFQRAADADPTDADYRFNLAVALARKKDLLGALQTIQQELKLRPQDAEASAFESTLRKHLEATAAPEPATTRSQADGPSKQADDSYDPSLPLERVKRSFNEASFRQAALELEQMQAIRLASLPPRQHADKLTESGNRFLHQGLILEAEREFQSALEIDGDNAGAHAGLAEVRERGGNATAARKEAQQSIAIAPNAPAYLVLARLDMAQNQLPSAAGNVSRALQLDRQSTEARDLRKQLESKGQNIP